jgi:hypothetical protein
MAKVKIIKKERDPPLFTGKLLIKCHNILRNTTRVIGLDMTENRIFTLCRTCMITCVVFLRMFLKFYQQLTGEERRIPFQTDGHGETSIPPYNFVAGGIKI